MRPIHLGPVPPTQEGKLKWCVDAIQQIARASRASDPNVAADAFTISNLTETRTLDADAADAEAIADVLGTFLQDLKRRGAKRSGE